MSTAAPPIPMAAPRPRGLVGVTAGGPGVTAGALGRTDVHRRVELGHADGDRPGGTAGGTGHAEADPPKLLGCHVDPQLAGEALAHARYELGNRVPVEVGADPEG